MKVWNVFMELINRRPSRFSPISFQELHAYLQLTGTDLDPVDVNRLVEMDRTFLDAIPKQKD